MKKRKRISQIVRKNIYILIAIIVSLSVSSFIYFQWINQKNKNAERVLREYHLTTIFHSSEIRGELFHVNNHFLFLFHEVNKLGEIEQGVTLNLHFFNIQKDLEAIFELQRIFKYPEYKSILERTKAQWNIFSSFADQQNLDNMIPKVEIEKQIPQLLVSIDQLQRLHTVQYHRFSSKLLEQKNRNRVFTIIVFVVIMAIGSFFILHTLGIIKEAIVKQDQAGRTQKLLISELEDKNAELERFTYTVSHDLKSPLITIRGFLSLLEKDTAEGNTERIKGDMKHIHEATEKMYQLLDELLELSRIGHVINPPQEISLNKLAREAMDLVSEQINKRGVQVKVSPDMPVIYGDHPRLLEVMQNLIDNATKYMGEQPNPLIEIGVKQEGEKTVCYVRDNGIGIDPRYHEKVFELFDRLDNESEGTGIGLTIVKRIIETHGELIWVESEGYGKGSAFCFNVPQKGGSG